MKSPEQLRQAVDDYQRTLFGEWNWGGPSTVHPRSQGRLAKHADGRVEQRDMPVAVSPRAQALTAPNLIQCPTAMTTSTPSLGRIVAG